MNNTFQIGLLQVISTCMLIVNCISLTLLIQTIINLRSSNSLTIRKFSHLLLGIVIEIGCATLALLPLNFDYLVFWGILRVIGRVAEITFFQMFLSYLKYKDDTEIPNSNSD